MFPNYDLPSSLINGIHEINSNVKYDYSLE